jgi:hypothetical protein
MLRQRWQAGGTRLRLRVDRQEIVVPAHERSNPILVLGSQNGASDIDDAPARLTKRNALSSVSSWSLMRCSSASGRMRHLASGLRRQAPEHGGAPFRA